MIGSFHQIQSVQDGITWVILTFPGSHLVSQRKESQIFFSGLINGLTTYLLAVGNQAIIFKCLRLSFGVNGPIFAHLLVCHC